MSYVNYSFKWPAGPEHVIVTGEFDDWKATCALEKSPTNGEFEITLPVSIQDDSDKVFFKFIVDDKWVTSGFYNIGEDGAGIENNYISRHELHGLNGSIPQEAEKAHVNDVPEYTKTRSAPYPQPGDAPQAVIARSSKTLNVRPSTQVFPPTSPANASSKKMLSHDSGLVSAAAPDGTGQSGKRIKVRRKIKRNKKTGERIVVSEERIPLDEDEDGPGNTTFEEEEISIRAPGSSQDTMDGSSELAGAAPASVATAAASAVTPTHSNRERAASSAGSLSRSSSRPVSSVAKSPSGISTPQRTNKEGTGISAASPTKRGMSTPSTKRHTRYYDANGGVSPAVRTTSTEPVGAAGAAGVAGVENEMHILPIENESKVSAYKSLAGEPGLFVPSDKEQLKAFSQVNDDVDPEAFNIRLTKEFNAEHGASSIEELREQSERKAGKKSYEKLQQKLDKQATLENIDKQRGLDELEEQANANKLKKDKTNLANNGKGAIFDVKNETLGQDSTVTEDDGVEPTTPEAFGKSATLPKEKLSTSAEKVKKSELFRKVSKKKGAKESPKKDSSVSPKKDSHKSPKKKDSKEKKKDKSSKKQGATPTLDPKIQKSADEVEGDAGQLQSKLVSPTKPKSATDVADTSRGPVENIIRTNKSAHNDIQDASVEAAPTSKGSVKTQTASPAKSSKSTTVDHASKHKSVSKVSRPTSSDATHAKGTIIAEKSSKSTTIPAKSSKGASDIAGATGIVADGENKHSAKDALEHGKSEAKASKDSAEGVGAVIAKTGKSGKHTSKKGTSEADAVIGKSVKGNLTDSAKTGKSAEKSKSKDAKGEAVGTGKSAEKSKSKDAKGEAVGTGKSAEKSKSKDAKGEAVGTGKSTEAKPAENNPKKKGESKKSASKSSKTATSAAGKSATSNGEGSAKKSGTADSKQKKPAESTTSAPAKTADNAEKKKKKRGLWARMKSILD